ncbi:serine hydrolase domain-containing protein [Microbacterium capsulatum]|uniref:Serine hydrolase domain-containing protein n=1 Tax=Microbacterium capsulatum TaxID=3041921 RepID=A0ABU0XI91_9MICO|nr:serine hydrolase domain-containing protein [Microbacterium sp. ASV81]MDQ4214859.1 serine hydrolase domain-containing protein [Microbacterium sp. ASV81]
MVTSDGTRRGFAAAAIVAIGLLVSGCTAGPGGSGRVAPSPFAATVTVDPAALRTRFAGLAKELGQPGAAMLVRTPQGEITATYGVTTLGGSTPVSLDDHFRIGSNTKTMTGTVILQLVQEGKLALTDKVSKYRPDVPNGDRITIEQLLTMRSGLANYTTTLALNTALDTQPSRAWDPEELAAMGLAEPPTFAPGDGWNYSNTNTVLLGLIAEQIEGRPLAEILRTRLFDPLGLRETSFPAITDASLPAPYAHGYMYSNNVDTIETSALPPDQLAQAKAGTLLPSDTTDLNPSWAWAAGSGISTIRDLAHWVEALGDGGALGGTLQRERLTSVQPVKVALPDAKYGWGIAEIGPLYGHTGELPGYNSFMGYDPVHRVTIVVWSNLAPAADGRPPAATIAVALMQSIYGG